jgi:hypothetical protein
MTTTTNLGLTQLEVGTKERELIINANNVLIDTKVPTALPDAATAPATTGKVAGSTYYNTTDSKVYWLRPGTMTWVALT